MSDPGEGCEGPISPADARLVEQALRAHWPISPATQRRLLRQAAATGAPEGYDPAAEGRGCPIGDRDAAEPARATEDRPRSTAARREAQAQGRLRPVQGRCGGGGRGDGTQTRGETRRWRLIDRFPSSMPPWGRRSRPRWPSSSWPGSRGCFCWGPDVWSMNMSGSSNCSRNATMIHLDSTMYS